MPQSPSDCSKNKLSLKEASKKEDLSNKRSSKLISKVDYGMGRNKGSKHKFDKDEVNKNEVVTLSSKIAVKCQLKKGAKKAALMKEGKTAFGKEGRESVDNDLVSQRNIKAVKPTPETMPQVKGRPRRRVSRVNYSEGVLEKGAATAEVENASEGNRSSDEEDVGEELRPSDGKRKGKCRLGEPEAEDKECSQGM